MPEVVDAGKRVSGEGKRKEVYSKKKWKYGSYPVALANATARASAAATSREGFPRMCVLKHTFAGSEYNGRWLLKKDPRTRPALFAVIDDAYVRAFGKTSRRVAILPGTFFFTGLGKDFQTRAENSR